jgi:hypothetical protein
MAAIDSYMNNLMMGGGSGNSGLQLANQQQRRSRSLQLVSDNARGTAATASATRSMLNAALLVSEQSYHSSSAGRQNDRWGEQRSSSSSPPSLIVSSGGRRQLSSYSASPLVPPTRSSPTGDYTFCPNEKNVMAKELPNHLRRLPYASTTSLVQQNEEEVEELYPRTCSPCSRAA